MLEDGGAERAVKFIMTTMEDSEVVETTFLAGSQAFTNRMHGMRVLAYATSALNPHSLELRAWCFSVLREYSLHWNSRLRVALDAARESTTEEQYPRFRHMLFTLVVLSATYMTYALPEDAGLAQFELFAVLNTPGAVSANFVHTMRFPPFDRRWVRPRNAPTTAE